MIEQGTEEWFQSRCGIASASNFSTVLAKGKAKGTESVTRRNYVIRLALERITGKPIKEKVNSFAMKQGTEREPLARESFEVQTGKIVRLSEFVKHPSLIAGSSPDGLIDENTGVEFKCPEPAAHLEIYESQKVPTEYVAQVQGNMLCTMRDQWYFVSYNPDFPEHAQLVILLIHADKDYQKILTEELIKFECEVQETVAKLAVKAA